jgi:hypothetical protein
MTVAIPSELHGVFRRFLWARIVPSLGIDIFTQGSAIFTIVNIPSMFSCLGYLLGINSFTVFIEGRTVI